MPAAAQTLLRISRPTVLVAGRELPALAEGLLDLVVEETTAGLARCELKVGNWGAVPGGVGFLYFDRRTLDFGTTLEIRLGGAALFQGRLTALEAEFPEDSPPTLCALAEDRFQDLRMVRRTVSYENLSDADLVRRLAARHGLTAVVDVDGPTHAVVAQVNQSDLAFLRERCRGVDAELWMDGTTLHAAARARRTGSPLRLAAGRELRSVTVTADLAGQRTSVAVSGWDVAAKAALRHVATEAAVQQELGGDLGGASALRAALGERADAVVHAVPLAAPEAQARAEALYRLGARRFVTARGVAQSDAGLRAGATVELQGLGPLFTGRYYLAEVRHLFDTAVGLRTEFVGERVGMGRP
jgi:uncharacterized protein